MTSLYSNDLRAYVNGQPWPRQLEWRMVEWPDNSCVKIVLIRESINALDSDDKLYLATLMSTMLNNIRKKGVPIYTWVMTRDEFKWRDRPAGFYLGDKNPG